jgi:hypothetical protein
MLYIKVRIGQQEPRLNFHAITKIKYDYITII